MYWRDALLARATGLAGGRVYWAERPQATTVPAVVLSAASDDRPQNLKGFNLAPARVQVDCYAATQEAVWALVEEVLVELVPGVSANGHNFSRADIALGPRDLPERIGNTTIFRVSMDLMIHHAINEEAS